ncbi:hypothetical protein [Tenggerimyces flavus]|uniref:Uncharacterized protein n=1 Tax=Tenggerimyces flavus TaxID=1708749 RepID=A0ABV7Y4Q4_9ACTN|nr:hypothetical protein [Tenggerimyces flavus]MBM7788690.1 hypothetical protein [Tenggerimyces flavus]
MTKVVKCDDIESRAKRVQEVLKPLIEAAKGKLEEINLHDDAMGSIGQSAVTSHNTCKTAHVENLKKGVEDFQTLHDGMMRTAENWRRSEEQWVVKGTPGY